MGNRIPTFRGNVVTPSSSVEMYYKIKFTTTPMRRLQNLRKNDVAVWPTKVNRLTKGKMTGV